MFDNDQIFNVQAGVPHLMEHLTTLYKQHLAKRMNDSRAIFTQTVDQVFNAAPARDFIAFAVKYLTETHIHETFAAELNLGMVLSDMSRITIRPDETDSTNPMQSSGAVGISEGRSQTEKMNGVTKSTALRIK